MASLEDLTCAASVKGILPNGQVAVVEAGDSGCGQETINAELLINEVIGWRGRVI